MHFDNKNPFLLKFLSSIDGYFQLFLSPIFIFLTTGNIKLSGLFFFLESVFRFISYGISGSLNSIINSKKLIIFSHTLRFIAAISSLIIFYNMNNNYNKFIILIILNFFFIISNSIFVTSFETIFQKDLKFNNAIQSQITSADLLSGGLSLLIILCFSLFKLDFIFLIPFYIFFYLFGAYYMRKRIESSTITQYNFKYTYKKTIKDLKKTLSILRHDKDMLKNTMIGYIPFSFFLIIEQLNIYKFEQLYQYNSMKLLHFGFKTVLFFSAGFLVPIIMKKTKNITSFLKYSIILMILGGMGSILTSNTLINVFSILCLGFSHYLVLNYRKLKRRDLMIKNNITFSTLGFFFAIEGLSGMFANLYLTIFGHLKLSLIMFFIIGISIIFIFYNKESKHKL